MPTYAVGQRLTAALLQELGDGISTVIARAQRTSAKTPITTESGYLRLDDIPVADGYAYRISTSNLTLDSTVDNEIGAARIRVAQNTSPGTAATTSSTQIGLYRSFQSANTNADLNPLVCYYYPSADGYLSVILTGQRVTALGTFQFFASATEPCHLVVERIGIDPGDTGVSL
jgi:hypothetical protein